MKITLINVIIFRSNIKFIGFFFRKLHCIHSNYLLFIILSILIVLCLLVKHIKIDFWVIKFSEMPLTNFAII